MSETAFSDEQLRQAFESLAADAVPRGDCPEPERLWEAARGELPSAERRALIGHIATCASCAKDWRVARDFKDEPEALPMSPEAAPHPPTSARFARSRTWMWGLAAAAGLVLAFALNLLRPAPIGDLPDVDPTYRAIGEQEIRSLLADTPLSGSDPRLRWTSGLDGARYHLLVTTADFEVLYEKRDLTSNEAVLPATVLEKVAPGDELLWRVEAIGPEGESFRSPTFTTRLE